MDIPNNSPLAQKDPPPGDTTAKKKTPNHGIALFSHQKNSADFSFFSNDDDADSIKNPPNDKTSPINKPPPNPHQEAMQALLMKKSPYTRANKTTFLVNFKGLGLSDLHSNKHSSALIKLQTKAINSGFNTQTIKYLSQKEKEFDGAINQYIEQMEAGAAKARQTKQKKAKSCDHVMVMQLDTTETIAAYNHMSRSKPRRANYKKRRFVCYYHKHHCMMADKGGSCVRCLSKYQMGVEFLNPGDPKELEEDTAPKTMPELVLMIHDSIAEATCAKFLEDTTANKQDITYNACSSVFFQMANNPHLESAKFQKTIKEAIAKFKGKMAAPSNDTQFHQNRLMTVKEIKQMPTKYVRDVKMEAFDGSCKENTTPETWDVARVLKKRVELSCLRGDDVEGCCNHAVVQWSKQKKIADKERDK
eukprot:jgi/Psemu1/7533/gm1.7533_g